MSNAKVEISTNFIFKTILILLGFWFLYLVRDIIVLLFLALIIAASIDPAVDWFQKKKIPRSVGASIIYVILFLIIGIIISFLIPPLTEQLKDFSQNSSQYFESIDFNSSFSDIIFRSENINDAIAKIVGGIVVSFSSISQNIFSKTIGVFSGFISTVVVFSLAFYMVMKEDGIKKFIVSITPDKKKEYASNFTDRVEKKIGKWMGGQLFLMVFIFILDFIGLSAIGIPYALVLAILAGILEIIPYVGPVAAAIPGVVLGFFISPVTGLLALLVYIIAQQVESHIIVPQVMKKAVGLNPVATIVAILIGFKLAGVLGAIISVPAATAISLFISDIMNKNE